MVSDEPLQETKSINVATREEVAELPFMNASRAEMIVHYREIHGDFGSIKDLQKVTGINERLAERVAEYFNFEPSESKNTAKKTNPRKKIGNESAENA